MRHTLNFDATPLTSFNSSNSLKAGAHWLHTEGTSPRKTSERGTHHPRHRNPGAQAPLDREGIQASVPSLHRSQMISCPGGHCREGGSTPLQVSFVLNLD